MVACLSVIFTALSPSLISRRTKKKTVFSMAMRASGKYLCYCAGAEEPGKQCAACALINPLCCLAM